MLGIVLSFRNHCSHLPIAAADITQKTSWVCKWIFRRPITNIEIVLERKDCWKSLTPKNGAEVILRKFFEKWEKLKKLKGKQNFWDFLRKCFLWKQKSWRFSVVWLRKCKRRVKKFSICKYFQILKRISRWKNVWGKKIFKNFQIFLLSVLIYFALAGKKNKILFKFLYYTVSFILIS